ncbi:MULTISPECIES: putative quorum-sensing-regulated virulence factor [unclassified Acinetobacter]|uniref:putative quorum-sensing-regulated virulence factor n=1 Tax=unclassified Acinetobacter TaxID=196816 RepID=UPI002934718E|nr:MULTISPECIES: DUF3820 family protein [unclassified Acinetobacter]WOE32782.1 DUF3820 family protein [Acinetobacter sp. SAAs470]WOE38259.1 DUF3820 family protein [Acinetobacter sp. SAAs474]
MNNSTVVMPFGKYAGTPISELKPSYVSWLLTLENLKSDLRLSLEKIVSDREKQFQRRKKLAIGLQQSHIASYERRAYKHNRGRGWNNSTGWN